MIDEPIDLPDCYWQWIARNAKDLIGTLEAYVRYLDVIFGIRVLWMRRRRGL